MYKKYFRVAKNISRWKKIGRIESILGFIADKSDFGKWLYIQYYGFIDREYQKKGRKFMKEELRRQSPNSSGYADMTEKELIRDMEYCLHRYGTSFDDYFIYRFYDLNRHGRQKFNTLKLQYGYCEQFNPDSVAQICEDKFATYKLLSKYYNRKVFTVKSTSDCNAEMVDALKNIPKIIFKPLRGHSGEGIRILDSSVFFVEKLSSLLTEWGPYILEEVITQGKEMAEIHPSSINTVRVATVNTEEGGIIYGCGLRMGRGGSNVDNAGSGGIYATVDPKYGIVISKAIDNLGNEYVIHPDSNTIIPGFRIPKWDELLDMIHNLSHEIPGAGLISWDLAYSFSGWCLIEANDIGDQHTFQAPVKEGVTPILYKLLDKTKRQNP